VREILEVQECRRLTTRLVESRGGEKMVGREEDASVARSMFGSVSSMGCAL
jgi:hypothetical protein